MQSGHTKFCLPAEHIYAKKIEKKTATATMRMDAVCGFFAVVYDICMVVYDFLLTLLIRKMYHEIITGE